LVDRRPARVGGGVGGGGGGSSGGAYVPTGERARENEGEKSIHLMPRNSSVLRHRGWGRDSLGLSAIVVSRTREM
jgi:hypothetical protein